MESELIARPILRAHDELGKQRTSAQRDRERSLLHNCGGGPSPRLTARGGGRGADIRSARAPCAHAQGAGRRPASAVGDARVTGSRRRRRRGLATGRLERFAPGLPLGGRRVGPGRTPPASRVSERAPRRRDQGRDRAHRARRAGAHRFGSSRGGARRALGAHHNHARHGRTRRAGAEARRGRGVLQSNPEPLRPEAPMRLTQLVIPMAVCALALAPTLPAQRPTALKGIWEPVNYSEDITLNDVFFITPEIGWVAGNAGTILYTRDGGATWTAQLGGDPGAQDPPIQWIRFIDAKHGWAGQHYGLLLRTTDGETWQRIGSHVPGSVAFLSPTSGFHAYGGRIYRTRAAGRTWQEVFTCRAKLQVAGLARDVSCNLSTLHFPSRDV